MLNLLTRRIFNLLDLLNLPKVCELEYNHSVFRVFKSRPALALPPLKADRLAVQMTYLIPKSVAATTIIQS